MADKFDPWYTWLGIPAEEQPVDHYRLLGIRQLEANPTVIENAADQRMTHLRSFQTGKHSDLSQQLLNAVATARVCLLNPEKKAAYDRDLLEKTQAAAKAKASPPPAAERFPQIHVKPNPPREHQPVKPVSPSSAPAQRAPGKKWAIVGGAVAVIVVVGTTAGIILAQRSHESDRVAKETTEIVPKAARSSDASQKPVAPPVKPQPCLVLQWPAADRRDARLEIDDLPPDLTKAQNSQNSDELRLSVKPGQHTVRIVRRGFEPFAQTVLVEQDKDARVVPHWKATDLAVSPLPKVKPGKNPEPKPEALPPTQVAEKPAAETNPKPDDEEASAKKVDPPSADEQKQLLREIDEVYKTGDVKDQAAKVALSRKLLEEGRKNEAKRNEQFVLLRRAGEIARDAGEAILMLETVDAAAAAGFNIQPFQVKAKLLSQLVEHGVSGSASQLSTVIASCVKFAEEAAASGALDEASEVLGAARNAVAEQSKQAQNAMRAARVTAARARSPVEKAAYEKKAAEAQTELDASDAAKSALAESVSGLQQMQREHKAFQTAQERLKSEPDDAEANLMAGEFLCFVRGDWERGLPHLSKGVNAELKALAEQEISSPPIESAEQLKLADHWWDLAQGAKHKRKDTILLHAGAWYEQVAKGDLTGLSKSRVETRLGQIGNIGRPLSSKVLTRRGPPLPVIVFGKWFPLLTSPDELVGWEGVDSSVRYGNRALETPTNGRITYPVSTKDVSIRTKAKKAAGKNIVLYLRCTDKGNYFAWFNGGRSFGISKRADGKLQDLKAGNSPQACNDFFEFGFSAFGDTLTLSVNGQAVVQTRDTSHTAGTIVIGGSGSGVFTDIEMFIPAKESLVADDRKPPTKTTGSRK